MIADVATVLVVVLVGSLCVAAGFVAGRDAGEFESRRQVADLRRALRSTRDAHTRDARRLRHTQHLAARAVGDLAGRDGCTRVEVVERLTREAGQ